MQVEYHRLHAFTTTRFHTGNPAAVFLLSSSPSSLSAESRQNLATEANLPNSVFLNPATTTSEGDEIPTYAADFYSRRAQIPLCGHATLFETVLSGTVYARREEGGRVAIDFPANHDGLVELDEGDDRSKKAVQGVLEAVEGLREEDVLAVAWVPLGPIVELATEVDLGGLKVDVEGFPALSPRMVILTQVAPAEAVSDIRSRVFAPAMGSDEDPVCGSAHCSVTPYFLGNATARARLVTLHPSFLRETEEGSNETLRVQHVSERGGELEATWDREAERVKLVGSVVRVSSGVVFL